MSDMNEVEQAIADANNAATEAPAEETTDTGAEETAEELILGKFKTDEDVRNAYVELENKMRAGEHKQPEPEPEEPEGPFAFLPATVSDEQWQQVAYGFQIDPVRTAIELYQNPQFLGPQLTTAVLREFAKEDPWSAAAAQAQIHQAQQQPQREDGVVQYVQEQRTAQVAAWARQELPDFGEHADEVAKRIRENSDYYGQFIDPDDQSSYARVVDSVYRDVLHEEYRAARAQQSEPVEAPQVSTARRTGAVRTTAEKKTTTTADQIGDMIANARI